MSEDASLDDFLGGESSEQSEAAEAAAARADEESASETEPADATEAETASSEDGEPAADGEPTADIEPAKTTYAWSDEGATCEDCGETVERRWQQDGGLVCIDCKDWERA